ncbi:MAG: ubiquinol cytochrome c reductase iron-sulfur subunit PetA [Roseibaca calidilacus]|uniref:Ubiquinol cytochrome c reductase iron-sulfur subunit PetA n=1 Tax=Roseibaca calidilacus TaxID=1666912 RepID=A0A0P7W999_9RHOB|nr:hypothetical protein [Roseibaca calidilacus]KPP90733.1 MAG: ubiquinol cytochrome c reductase iron-sulfur subunit PetA [Roseibaca calidilacus]CUX83468.1 hypothetical protein Ga0058931_3001 [Roseibaca calidilacus]
MERRSLLTIAAIALPAMLMMGCVQTTATTETTQASAPPAFSALAGSYTGQYIPDRGAPEALALVMRPDGTYTFSGAFDSDGKLTQRGDQIRYANALGSRGVVTVAGDTLSWRNTFTGDSYTISVTR